VAFEDHGIRPSNSIDPTPNTSGTAGSSQGSVEWYS